MRHGSLFSGIGGFDLASEWMEWTNVFHCEINPFCQKILKHYWPNADSLENIKTTEFTKYEGQIDIISGGFPCQPYSVAGQRKGTEDDRHLWPEMLRAIREIKPKWVVGENVYGLVNWNGGLVFEEVHTDLEAEGYEVWAVVLPAVAKNAPHRRDRIWIVAYSASNRKASNRCSNSNERRREAIVLSKNEGWESKAVQSNRLRSIQGVGYIKRIGNVGSTNSYNSNRIQKTDWENFPTQSPIFSGDDGLSGELDGITVSKWRNESIKGYGNAVVPQVVFEIFKTIQCF